MTSSQPERRLSSSSSPNLKSLLYEFHSDVLWFRRQQSLPIGVGFEEKGVGFAMLSGKTLSAVI